MVMTLLFNILSEESAYSKLAGIQFTCVEKDCEDAAWRLYSIWKESNLILTLIFCLSQDGKYRAFLYLGVLAAASPRIYPGNRSIVVQRAARAQWQALGNML